MAGAVNKTAGDRTSAAASAEAAPDWDVVIVGCGPVGGFAANLLGKSGLKVLILERDLDAFPLPRAVHLDHEMMRLFADADLLDLVEPLMFATDGHMHLGADGNVIRYLGSVGCPRPFAFSNDYFFYQPELEAALRRGLDRLPTVELRFEAVAALAQYGREVVLTLETGEAVRARYVIACDGARSTVRKALDIPLQDLGFEEPWLVVDAEVDGPIQFPPIEGAPIDADFQRLSVMVCDPRRPATIVPGRGNHRRWEFMLLPGENDQDMASEETVRGFIAPWIGGAPYRLVRASTYRFHALVAERWRMGRVFLAGDAAHQTPPFFGQGMCHGLRDVANLAWKLGLVLAGKAAPSLLETYQPERDPHVRTVIGAAVEAGRYICLLDADLAAERDRRLRSPTAPGTASDLIPPLGAGIVEPGAGERFIQPLIRRSAQEPRRLDEITGGGWLIVQRDGEARLSDQARAVWTALGGGVLILGDEMTETARHLATWFERHSAIAAVVRPDFYTYAAPADAAELSGAVERLGRWVLTAPVSHPPQGVAANA